jgi:hypothetical protein
MAAVESGFFLEDMFEPSDDARTPSTLPVALDVFSRGRAESTFSLTMSGLRRPQLNTAILLAIGAFVGILVLGLAIRAVSTRSVVEVAAAAPPARAPIAMSRVAPASAPAATAVKAAAGSGVPTVDIASLPQSPVGTVSLAAVASSHRLFVDGVVAANGTVVVSCGQHFVKVGSKGRSQSVDVPCGTDVVVGQ